MTQQLTDKAYDRPDAAFWEAYIRGRPHPPPSLFERIYRYHAEHSNGVFDTVHDVGAGIGPYSAQLRRKFSHVIVSDIAASSINLARERLGTDGFTYRVARIEDADAMDTPPGSVDMVFASNMMHFADVNVAQRNIATQLKSGGTFVCGLWGIAAYRDPEVQAAWMRLYHRGMEVQARVTKEQTRRLETFARLESCYDHVPMEEEFFLAGAERVEVSDLTSMSDFLPESLRGRVEKAPSRVGKHDRVVRELDEGWVFRTDLKGMKDQFESMSFSNLETHEYVPFWEELEKLIGDGREVEAWWPARVMLATRR